MSKASYSWQKIVNLLLLLLKDKRLRKVSRGLCCLLVSALFWWFNWKLFLATVVGITLMAGCYLLQNSYWQRYYQKWQKFLVGSNRQLVLAVSTGGVGAFLTYLAASVWVNSENQWLATGAILQGLITLATLSLLLWSLGNKRGNLAEARLENLLRDLTNKSPLKRLIAIRQLTRILISQSLPPELYFQSLEYFQLMLSEPQLPVVRNALLESLELLDIQKEQRLTPHSTPLKIPLQLKHHRKPIKIPHN